MKTNLFVVLLMASTVTTSIAAAQSAPFNEIGVTMGHWHIASKDVEANTKLFLAMGGKLFMPGGNPLIMFPGLYINLNLGTEKGDGGTEGSVVNHVGFIVNNVQERVAQWKAAGVAVLAGNNNRLDQAFVVTPDGVRIEILEDKTQSVPIRGEHVHFWVPEAEVAKAQVWYAKTFGGKMGTRNKAPVVKLSSGRRSDRRCSETVNALRVDYRESGAVAIRRSSPGSNQFTRQRSQVSMTRLPGPP
ncbi:MAG TPA: VOC family protein [Vicinamibacterales bacterium]